MPGGDTKTTNLSHTGTSVLSAPTISIYMCQQQAALLLTLRSSGQRAYHHPFAARASQERSWDHPTALA